MRDTITRLTTRVQSTFAGFTAGQKVVAVIGTGALLLAGFMVFRWAAAPSYAPLFSNLASSDASAIIQQLDAEGIPYQLSNGGNTIMVPQAQVYSTRISLSGEGLPSSNESGYSLLDNQSLSTSQFQEQTSFKRAMEGELQNTIEAIDGVDAAVVHLAMPPKQVFTDTQDPTTASVLLKTRAGTTLTPEQVQAVVNLVSSSVDGLATDKVTVADSTGRVLSAPGASAAGAAQSQMQQVTDFQNRMSAQVQATLDRVVGPGNSTVQITPVLNFDETVSQTTRYFGNADMALSASETTEKLRGGNGLGVSGGVVGPDGQMDPGTTGTTGSGQTYDKKSRTSDNAVNNVVEQRQAAPGGVESLHVGIVLDTQALNGRDPAVLQTNIASALGIDNARGDTIDVSTVPFDRTAETAAAAELKAATAADASVARMSMIRNGGLVGVIALMLLIAWFRARRRAKARVEATSYVVDQLRRDALERQSAQAALDNPNPALLALESSEDAMTNEIRDEIAALVERQPEDVANLLRGWLVER